MRAVLVAALLASCVPALAHDSWISRGGLRNAAGEWCCGAGDCFELSAEQVRTGRGGYVIGGKSVVAGKDKIFTEIVPYSESQPSPDGQFWRCQRPDGSRRCFFSPPNSF